MELGIVYNGDRSRRVIIVANADGTFGFREEAWSNEPQERTWLPVLWPKSHCDSAATAYREALGRIAWLADVPPLQEFSQP